MNRYIRERLLAVQKILIACHGGGHGLPSAMIGAERELFIRKYLEAFFPNDMRFCSGVITGIGDAPAELTGQEDIIVEYPFDPSFPLTEQSDLRLVLAENVVCVIEVKSDISQQSQQDGATGTISKVRPIKRHLRFMVSDGGAADVLKDSYNIGTLESEMGTGAKMLNYERHPEMTPPIPTFVVSYKGPASGTLKSYVNKIHCDGILCIETGDFVVKNGVYSGIDGFFHFLVCITLLRRLASIRGSSLFDYGK